MNARALAVRRQPETVFVIRFAVLAAGVAALWAGLSPCWPTLEGATATMIASLARAVGTGASVTGSTLVVWSGHDTPFSFTVSDGCTGLSLILIYAVAVLAYPATRRQWWIGLACGSLALFAVNTVRLTSLAWIGAHSRSSFESAHEIWWQGAGAVAVCLAWFLWLRMTVLRAAVLPIPHSRRAAVTGRVARTVLRSRFSVTVLLFLAVFTALAMLGMVGGVLVYGRIVSPLRWLISTVVLHAGSTLPRLSDEAVVGVFALPYAFVIGGAALLTAVPGVPSRVRIRRTIAIYVPLAVALDAVGLGVYDAIAAAVGGRASGGSLSGAAVSTVNSLLMALQLALPLVLWRRWSRQVAEIAERQMRNACRRGQKG